MARQPCRILRATMNRMLVRRVDREWQGLIGERQRTGGRTTGHDEYASMTELIDAAMMSAQFAFRGINVGTDLMRTPLVAAITLTKIFACRMPLSIRASADVWKEAVAV